LRLKVSESVEQLKRILESLMAAHA